MESILMLLVYIAIFSLVAWGVVVLIPAPNPTVAMIKNIAIGVVGLIFVFWLLHQHGWLGGHGSSILAPTHTNTPR